LPPGEAGDAQLRDPDKRRARSERDGILQPDLKQDFAEHALNETRHWTNRGGVVPEVRPIDHITSSDPDEALKIAFKAALRTGATLDRCQASVAADVGSALDRHS
jgi:hypothetical protein